MTGAMPAPQPCSHRPRLVTRRTLFGWGMASLGALALASSLPSAVLASSGHEEWPGDEETPTSVAPTATASVPASTWAEPSATAAPLLGGYSTDLLVDVPWV